MNQLKISDMTREETIEAAYLAGFEPSADDLTPHALFTEAFDYLFKQLIIG